MVHFSTTPERYEVKTWGLWRNTEKIEDAAQLVAGDLVKFNVAFTNLMIDKECVLMIRSYRDNEETGLLAQQITIFPDVLPFDLTSESFCVPEGGADRIELFLVKDFALVTPEEEDRFLLGKYIHGAKKAQWHICRDDFVRVEETVSERPSLYLGDYKPCQKLFAGAVCFMQDSDALWILDGKYRAGQNVIRKDGKLWIPLQTAQSLFGKSFEGEDGYIELSQLAEALEAYCYTNRFGLGVISDLPYDYGETMYQNDGRYMVRLLAFTRPKAAELKKLFKQRVRPRCLGTRAEVKRAVSLAKTDHRAQFVSQKLLDYADNIAMKLPVQYKLDRDRTQSCFITAIIDYDDIMALYWAYLMRNDKRYLDRIKEHVLAMAGLDNWCGDHFYLMTSRALVTLGMIYDFLYDEFTPAEREIMAKAMVEKGFKEAMVLYYGQADEACWPWCIRRTNWNFIPNSGIIFAACVLFGEYETDICADVLEKAIQSLEFACIYLAPDGEWLEGHNYAAYSWNYVVFALQALYANFGTAFELDTTAGAQNSYKIPYEVMTSQGIFTLGDAGSTLNLNTGYTMWFARHFGDHSIQCMRHMQIAAANGNKPNFTDMLWFDDQAYDTAHFDLDYYFESTETAVSRSGWQQDASVFCIHAGDNAAEHGHTDLGSFEYENLGFRFAKETGIDGGVYCTIGSRYMTGGEYDYYCARAEGHNVYVINPDRSRGQSSYAGSKLITLCSNQDSVQYKMDMESAYRGQVKDAVRYCALMHNRRVFVVQDEIIPQKSGDAVYWFWHTFAQIDFKDIRAVETEDNTVILTAPKGQKLHIQFDANIPFVLRKGVSIPMETSPSPFDQLQNGIISNLLTAHFITGDEPILFRSVAWAEGEDFTPEKLRPFEA